MSATEAEGVYDWYRRGLDLLSQGHPAAAAQLLARAAEAEPESRSVREALARAQFDSGNYADARESFGFIVEANPTDDYAQFGLGLSALRTDDASTAVVHLALAVAMRPEIAHYRRALHAARAATPAASTGTLRGSTKPLMTDYDVALLDLDGVVYVGDLAVEHAAESIDAARQAGMRVAFVTNNASRTPETVAERLTALGVTASADDVITSSMAVARLLEELAPPASSVLVVGGDGLRTAVAQAGFTVVASADDAPAAVVQGYTPDTTWAHLAEATVAVNRGVLWIAANLDATMPSPRGPVPGNGALVGAVATATGRIPLVAGKPETPLHAEAVRRTEAQRPLVVGDRLDSDIEGAVRGAADSLLVLTGVTDARRLLRAAPNERPTYLARDLRGLLTPHPEVVSTADGVTCGAWIAHGENDRLTLRTVVDGDTPDDDAADLDALRALASAAWQQPGWNHVHGPADVLTRLGLADPGESRLDQSPQPE